MQPGSCGGSQSVEAEHNGDFRGAFVDDEGNALCRLTPPLFFEALGEVGVYKGRQLRT